MITLYNQRWGREDLRRYVGKLGQIAGVRLLEGADGAERGARVLQVWTGSGLCFDVLADRCLDIAACHYRGVPLAWLSPAGAPHPAYYEPAGMGWLRSFQGGLFATCGLDQFGAPAEDAGEQFGLHGRAASLPASALSYRADWQGDDYLLEVSGEVRQARIFGENLLLRRRISARLGSSQIQIEDTVTNEGFAPQPHMLLYHFNLGFPLLSEHAQLRLDAQATLARDADAQAGLADWQRFSGPVAGYREQVFRHAPQPDSAGRVRVELANPALGLGLRLSYAHAELPHLFQWKMLGEGTYVLGLEPANSSGIGGRAAARQSGDLPVLEPGERRSYTLDVEVFECV